MKISVSSGAPVGEHEQFAYLKACGFDALDMNLGTYFDTNGKFCDMSQLSDGFIHDYFTGLRKDAEKVGFEIGQTHSAFTGHPGGYPGGMEDMVARQIASIKATHELGAKYCVIHPIILPGRFYDRKAEEDFDISAAFYRQLIPVLEEYDVYACLENMWNVDPIHHHICPTVFSHAQEMVEMCQVLGDRFRICVDVGHGALTGDDPADMVRICGDKLGCLHVHDNDGLMDLHTFPYSTYEVPYSLNARPMRIDWDDLMKALDDVHYCGNLNFEVSIHGPDPVKKAGFIYLHSIGQHLASLRKEA